MPNACKAWEGPLASAALGRDDPQAAAFSDHIVTCDACRYELKSLQQIVQLLPASPPAALDTRALANPALAGSTPEDTAARRTSGHGTTRRRNRRRLGALVATAAVILAVILVGTSQHHSPPVIQLRAVSEPSARADATLTKDSTGTAINLQVGGLRAGETYWLWVTDSHGQRVAAGSFQGGAQSALHFSCAVSYQDAKRIWVTGNQNQVVLDAPVTT